MKIRHWLVAALVGVLASAVLPRVHETAVAPAEAFYRASIIKSIQTGTITINTGATTGTATLTTAVSSTSTVLIPGGTTTANSAGNGNWGDATFVLTNPTTVTMTCPDDTTSSPTCAGSFTAIEYYPNVLSSTGVQRGVATIAVGATSQAATITSIVTSKSVLVPCGFNTTAAPRSAYAQTTQVITSATAITASRNAADGINTVSACWQVLEFK